jgi:transcriptional regulator GlxA family with amidase domain
MQDSFETCPPLDIVLIGAHNMKYTPNEAELAFVRKAWEDCSAFLTICGGVLVPQAAGILEGKTATGPRPFLPMLKQQAPGTNWIEKRWVSDGKLWTSSTLLNGTDMMIAFAKETWRSRAPEGEFALVDHAQQLGAWPARDLDFKDVPWAL